MADALTNRSSIQPVDTEQGIVPATAAPVGTPNPDLPEEGMMTLRDHLVELRNRVFKIALGVLVGSTIGFVIARPVLEYFQKSVCPNPAGDCRWQVIDPTEPLVIYLKVALYIGASLSLPITLYQIIRFVVPGLTRNEKRMLFIALPFVSILFVTGAAFALSLVLPAMLNFLQTFASDIVRADFRATEMLSLTLGVTIWMGIIFEMPLVMVILTRLGVVTWQKLLSWWRYALVIIMILSAIITPTPDPVNMMIVAGPMVLLYGLGIFLARLFAVRPVAVATGAA